MHYFFFLPNFFYHRHRHYVVKGIYRKSENFEDKIKHFHQYLLENSPLLQEKKLLIFIYTWKKVSQEGEFS